MQLSCLLCCTYLLRHFLISLAVVTKVNSSSLTFVCCQPTGLLSNSTLQMFVACRGLPTLVTLLETDYSAHRDLVLTAVECTVRVIKMEVRRA